MIKRIVWTCDFESGSPVKTSGSPAKTAAPSANPLIGQVFVKQEWGHISSYYSLFMKTNASAEPLRLFKPGEVRGFRIVGDNIFIAGTATNEPPGIWEYNVPSGTFHCLLSPAILGLEHTECPPFECKTFTNSDGTHFSYHIWTPAHFSPDKKYPLIIGNTHYSWIPYPMAAANAGFFFVIVDRKLRSTKGIARMGPKQRAKEKKNKKRPEGDAEATDEHR